MALTQEDLQALGEFVDARVAAATANVLKAPPPVEDDPETAHRKESEPWYYVHLADGRVLESQDSASTHIDDVAVIGRYPRGT